MSNQLRKSTATVPNPDNSIITLSPALSHTVLTKRVISTTAVRSNRHFLGSENLPAFSGKEGDSGEEFQCAQMLDSLSDKVEFWLRNVAKHVNSFRLPLASGFFYPDFVAKLKDGRIFVVEYKGQHLAGSGNDDTNERRVVGTLWEKASGGKGLFAMIEKEVAGRDMRGQLSDPINRRP